jgi:proteic killer suppression protein
VSDEAPRRKAAHLALLDRGPFANGVMPTMHGRLPARRAGRTSGGAHSPSRPRKTAGPAIVGSVSEWWRRYLDTVYCVQVCCNLVAIQSFANPLVERFFMDGRIPKRVGWAKLARVATRKLDMLDYAGALGDLAAPPGNRLEGLRGDLAGFHSIRINDQWRVVFRWGPAGPGDVDIRDYH